ncbi:MAG: NFACT family protein [Thermomicrobiales bacterium]
MQRVGLAQRNRSRRKSIATDDGSMWWRRSVDPEPAFYRSVDPFAVDPGLVTPFSLLLRKYVRGATLLDIDQPPLERIVRLKMATSGFGPIIAATMSPTEMAHDDAEENLPSEGVNETTSQIEPMGRRSNVILVDANGRDGQPGVIPQDEPRAADLAVGQLRAPTSMAWARSTRRDSWRHPIAARSLCHAMAATRRRWWMGCKIQSCMASEAVWRARAQDAQVGQCNPTASRRHTSDVAPLRTNSYSLYSPSRYCLLIGYAWPFLSFLL